MTQDHLAFLKKGAAKDAFSMCLHDRGMDAFEAAFVEGPLSLVHDAVAGQCFTGFNPNEIAFEELIDVEHALRTGAGGR